MMELRKYSCSMCFNKWEEYGRADKEDFDEVCPFCGGDVIHCIPIYVGEIKRKEGK